MVAVMVGEDSAVVQNSHYNTYNHGEFAFFFFEQKDVQVSILNKATRKLHSSLNNNVVTYPVMSDRLFSWVKESGLKVRKGSISVEDVLIGYLEHVLRLELEELAMIVHQFHYFKNKAKSDRECIPEFVWRKILYGRKKSDKRGCMGLEKKLFFEEE